ncbi:hypothetical protein [Flavobacterium sp.]|uniref:hypothetical protein n=1 Tax=Flavobacterium sp. TaxID=239 RepID=UPI0025EA52F1|nr:hypothetical protein [Flavobacterium sp.]
MKNYTSSHARFFPHKSTFVLLFLGLFPSLIFSQDYRTINAYMEDFAKNELYVKKSLMDYSVTIVESKLYTRTQYAAERIITKLENVNTMLKTNNKGFEGNTSLRDGFIKMNQKTIDCLKNGTLILSDYEYQASLPLAEIAENFVRKERELRSYYDELEIYEATKKSFAQQNKFPLKVIKRKNILVYNAFQNLLFYKMNVLDEKLVSIVMEKDKAGFSECLRMLDAMNLETMDKTAEYRNDYTDTSLNDASAQYADFIAEQKAKLSPLFNDYADQYNSLKRLKDKVSPETTETIDEYNNAVINFNAKKKLFYTVFNNIQATKDKLYNNWLDTNSSFLKRNAKFDSIYANTIVSESDKS